MDKTFLITLLISAALAMPVWMAQRKVHKRPWLVGWLFVVGLLILPYGLTIWLHPDWLNHPMPDMTKYLVVLPALLSLCALGGGLAYLLAPLALALLFGAGKAFGDAFKGVECQQDEGDEVNYWDDWDPRNPYAFENEDPYHIYGCEDD